MGHSSIKVTFDLHGHLMPGSEAEAAALLDRYLRSAIADGRELARQFDGARVRPVSDSGS
jgi:hypothetical protein